jgi:uncharacterized short protein YbdD (DUF466 family)
MQPIIAWLRRAGDIVRRVIGVPDYERYLAHLRARHPTVSPLSRDQFIAACMRERYEKPGSRCC